MSCWTYSLKVPCTDLAILPSLLARALEQGGWWYDSFVYTPSPMSRIPPAHHYNHLLKISDALAFWVALFRVKKGCLVKKSKQSFFFNTFFLLANIAAFIYDFFFLLDCFLGEYKEPLHSAAVNVLHLLRVQKGQAYHPVKLALLFFLLWILTVSHV